ncbi:MAG: hypothetical protein EOM25_11475 [Deltaproteobacteria bacterium]|nr:hypothetical protein [Deltaproteobacteria bacterium]
MSIFKFSLFFAQSVFLVVISAFWAWADTATTPTENPFREEIMVLENEFHVFGQDQERLGKTVAEVMNRLGILEKAVQALTAVAEENSRESARLLEELNRVVADSADLAEQLGRTAQDARMEREKIGAAQAGLATMVQKLDQAMANILTAKDLEEIQKKTAVRLDGLEKSVRELTEAGVKERATLGREGENLREKLEAQDRELARTRDEVKNLAKTLEESEARLQYFRDMVLANNHVLESLNATLSTVHRSSEQSLQDVQETIYQRTVYGMIVVGLVIAVLILMLLLFRRRPSSSLARPVETPPVRADDEDLVDWLERRGPGTKT